MPKQLKTHPSLSYPNLPNSSISFQACPEATKTLTTGANTVAPTAAQTPITRTETNTQPPETIGNLTWTVSKDQTRLTVSNHTAPTQFRSIITTLEGLRDMGMEGMLDGRGGIGIVQGLGLVLVMGRAITTGLRNRGIRLRGVMSQL